MLGALADGERTAEEIVKAVYPANLRKNLRSAATRNVRTHLEKLKQEGRAVEQGATYSIKAG